MKYIIPLLAIIIALLAIPTNISQPSFNGTNPGCAGGGCHTFQDGMVSVSVTDLQVQINKFFSDHQIGFFSFYSFRGEWHIRNQ